MKRALPSLAHPCLPIPLPPCGAAGQVAERLAAARPGFGSGPRLNSVDSSPALLLCMPLLWSRCPSLRPLGVHLWHQTVASLQGMGPARLASCLPQGSNLTKAVAAAALMGNLVEFAPAALKVGGRVGGLS